MKNIVCAILFAFSAANGSAIAQHQTTVDSADKAYVDNLTRAVAAAYSSARQKQVNTKDKTVVVAYRHGFFVVSFVNTKRQYGGQSHFVYDWQKNKIVHVIIEE